jgi:hypothetical protein
MRNGSCRIRLVFALSLASFLFPSLRLEPPVVGTVCLTDAS